MTARLQIEIFGVHGIGEVRPGADIAALLRYADVRDGDILVVTSKIVSKAEGRIDLGEHGLVRRFKCRRFIKHAASQA